MGKKTSPTGDPPEAGWHYFRTGAPRSGRVGPLTWDELQALAASGVLWPIDLVLHPIFPQWAEAAQIPGLFPHIVPRSSNERGPSPRRSRSLATPFSCEQPGEHIPYELAWTAPAPRRPSRALPFLLPLLVASIIGGGFALYLTL